MTMVEHKTYIRRTEIVYWCVADHDRSLELKQTVYRYFGTDPTDHFLQYMTQTFLHYVQSISCCLT